MLVKLSCFLLQVNATHFTSQCRALSHKFHRILALRLDGAFGRLCDIFSFRPLRIALIMTPFTHPASVTISHAQYTLHI